jgi:hypothetical protein
MMLLMGMWMSLTKKPMNPMMANPMAVAMAIFWNSFLSGFVHRFTSLQQQELRQYRTVLCCGQLRIRNVYPGSESFPSHPGSRYALKNLSSVADPGPGSGAFLTPGSQDHIFKSFLTIFFGKKFYNFLRIGPNFFSSALQN